MDRGPFCLLTLILLAGCGNTAADSSRTDAPDTTSLHVPEVSPAQMDLAAAQAVIREYYDAIASRDYQRAYLLWGDSGRSSDQTFEEFRAGFRNTAAVDVRVGEPGRIEGAAGSRFVVIPVQIEAEEVSEGVQRFAGSYTLRRAVVEGASEAQLRWHIFAADISACPDTCPSGAGDSAQIAELVHRFGERLRMVSLIGPRDIAVRTLREQYGPLVTNDLLARWIDDPTTAVGRQVSNPWPQRLEINDLHADSAEAWLARANIVHVTSADTTQVVDRTPVTLHVVRDTAGVWRISDVDR
jgi:hypothetical protein